jgi:hypothetical protein
VTCHSLTYSISKGDSGVIKVITKAEKPSRYSFRKKRHPLSCSQRCARTQTHSTMRTPERKRPTGCSDATPTNGIYSSHLRRENVPTLTARKSPLYVLCNISQWRHDNQKVGNVLPQTIDASKCANMSMSRAIRSHIPAETLQDGLNNLNPASRSTRVLHPKSRRGSFFEKKTEGQPLTANETIWTSITRPTLRPSSG